jgi:hypothetical protein
MSKKTNPPVVIPEQFLSFIRVQLQRRGLEVRESIDGFDFENAYLAGTLTLKPIILTWKEKAGFEILDTPAGKGKSSASFKNISDALTFITMRLAKKSA